MSAIAAPAPASPPSSYVIQGRTVTLPVCVRDARVVVANFVVAAGAVRALLPTSNLQPVEVYPGGALCSLGAIEYRDNDLGEYNEFAVNFFVVPGTERPLPLVGALRGFWRREVGVYVHRLPVTTSFSRDAGYGIWGFPKTVDEITFEDRDRRRSCTLVSNGTHVLKLTIARGFGRVRLPEAPQDTYTWADGRLRRTPSVMRGDGVGFRLGGAELTLGTHPIADELRSIGLPRRALMSMSMEHLAARFEAPQEV
jgi:hypothetical protein